MTSPKQNAEYDSSPNASSESFEIILTDEATYSLAEIPSPKIYSRITALIDFLANHPYYGEKYDPYYEASFPPIECRVFFCARYGIYYHVFPKEQQILILAVEDSRKDPLSRFDIAD